MQLSWRRRSHPGWQGLPTVPSCIGQTYNIGGHNERTNLHVVETICDVLDRLEPSVNGSRRHLISFVDDRPGHDRRYAIDATKLERELGWHAQETFETGLEKTVKWYLDNRAWWRDIIERGYRATRIGVIGGAGRRHSDVEQPPHF